MKKEKQMIEKDRIKQENRMNIEGRNDERKQGKMKEREQEIH